MELELTLDLGSTHLGSLENMERHIDRAAGLPVMLKAQLFEAEDAGPNCWLSFDLYAQAWEYAQSCGVKLFASVFSDKLARQLSELDRSLCKLAVSKRSLILDPWMEFDKPPMRSLFDRWIVSYPLTEATIGEAPNVRKLLCISEYPTWYYPALTAVDWSVWHGWSSHTFGFEVELGLIRHLESVGDHRKFMIEKHVRLDSRNSCPDATFAVSWDEVKQYVKDSTNT